MNGLGGGSYVLQSCLMAALTDGAGSRTQRSVLLARARERAAARAGGIAALGRIDFCHIGSAPRLCCLRSGALATAGGCPVRCPPPPPRRCQATAAYYFCGFVGPLAGGYLESDRKLVLLQPGCWYCHGGQYQLAYVVFFATNALLLLVTALAFRESLPPVCAAATAGGQQQSAVRVGRGAECPLPGALRRQAANRDESALLAIASRTRATMATSMALLRSRAVLVLSAVFILL